MTNSSRISLHPKPSRLPSVAAVRRLWRRLAGYTFIWQFATVFAVVSLFVVAFTGFGLSRFLGQSIKDGEIDDAVTEVRQHVAVPIAGRLAAQGSLEPMTDDQYDEFNAFVQGDIIPTGRSRLRIWRWDAVLLYSSDSSAQIGQEFPASDELEAARQGKAVSRVDDATDLVGTAGFGAQSFFHVFVPLSLDGTSGVQAVLEVEQPYLPVHDRIQRAETAIYVGVAGAMGFLYAVLCTVVMRGSRTVSKQRRQLVLHTQELRRSHDSMLQMLCAALDLRDQATKGHSLRVARLAVAVGEQMGLSEEQLTHLEQAAMLHDLSKMGLSDVILGKIGPLEEDEWEEIQKHPEMGYQIVRDIPFLHEAGEIILHHHERVDGGGYPKGLMGEEIPLGARIFAVVDAYDAMTSDRPYRRAGSHAFAVREIKRNSGTQFDTPAVEAFLAANSKGLIRDQAAATKKNGEQAVELAPTTPAEAEAEAEESHV
jgi:HD-GYP domain-containing protein (c-di-GMP phosphodiesterase class II)